MVVVVVLRRILFSSSISYGEGSSSIAQLLFNKLLFLLLFISISTNNTKTSISRSGYASAVSDDGFGFGGVINVNYKFAGMERSLSALKAHDTLRHLRILAAGVDLPLGGTGRPDSVGFVVHLYPIYNNGDFIMLLVVNFNLYFLFCLLLKSSLILIYRLYIYILVDLN